MKTNLISGHLGAEITGVNLAEPTPLQIEYINKAWLDHKVLVFRDQDITREQHIEFGKNFGDLETHPFAPSPDGYPEIVEINQDVKQKDWKEGLA